MSIRRRLPQGEFQARSLTLNFEFDIRSRPRVFPGLLPLNEQNYCHLDQPKLQSQARRLSALRASATAAKAWGGTRHLSESRLGSLPGRGRSDRSSATRIMSLDRFLTARYTLRRTSLEHSEIEDVSTRAASGSPAITCLGAAVWHPVAATRNGDFVSHWSGR